MNAYDPDTDSGTILENEPPGTQGMQVQVIDGVSNRNDDFLWLESFNLLFTVTSVITFELADNTEFFSIDQQGIITSKVSFDREARESYDVKVVATDGSSSALSRKLIVASQVFRIDIGDKNDHPPKFKQDEYLKTQTRTFSWWKYKRLIATQLRQLNIHYSIESGNTKNSFKIESETAWKTGRITTNQQLDYEEITEYSLRIKAFDGIYSDYATVKINIANINDSPPEFLEDEYLNEILEEFVYHDCILNIGAYDPDIKDRNLPQRIKYKVSKEDQRELLSIDDS
jgi:hypothetical protein